MHALRALILNSPRAAVLAVLLVLCMKALLPAGTMLQPASKTFMVTLCDDTNGGLKKIAIEVPTHTTHGADKDMKAKGEGTCSFSSLSMVALGGADAILLALAFAVILLLGLAPTLPPIFGQPRYIQPPLRGPPATA